MQYFNPPMLSAGFSHQGKKVRQRLENILEKKAKKKGYFLPVCALALLMTGALVACASARAAEIPTPVQELSLEKLTMTELTPTAPSENPAAAEPVSGENQEDCLCEPLNEPETETEPVLYRSPLGAAARIICTFGGRAHPISGEVFYHYGVDLEAAEGTPVYAAADGTVTAAEYEAAYGYHVVLTHDGGETSLYGHMKDLSVTEGQTVSAGDCLGTSGQSGFATGPHLHFEIRDASGAAVDPTAAVS